MSQAIFRLVERLVKWGNLLFFISLNSNTFVIHIKTKQDENSTSNNF